jgi:hypothetical protein
MNRMEGTASPVSGEERVLLIVNCLAEHGDERFQYLYQFIEKTGISLAKRYLGHHYRSIITLKDQEANLSRFLSCLSNLADDPRNLALDLFLQLHGLKGEVRFFDQWVLTSRLSEEVRQVVKRDCLRLVYNTSCYGDSHSIDFLRAGFKVSVGPLKVNANAATEYPAFCRRWRGSRLIRSREMPVAEVVRRADRTLPRLIQDWVAGHYFKDVDSNKVIRGDGMVTINTMPR